MMIAKWSDLLAELDGWQEAGDVATFWWRDDDATAPTAQLLRLMSIAPEIPLSLAVIPASAEQELAEWLATCPRSATGSHVAVLQHGWRHVNHAGGRKKSEFPAERPSRAVEFDLAAGRARLIELFETRALPVLVPPWNRFDDSFLALLPLCGVTGISRVQSRSTDQRSAGIIESNIHVDLVAWTSGRRFVGEEPALGALVGHLRARRHDVTRTSEPTGILTHHFVQDEATGAFLEQLAAVSVAHPAARWLDAGEIFASAP
jgi:hypothetical protein